MKLGSFGVALLISAGSHLLVLGIGLGSSPAAPVLSIDIGEMSVEVVEVATTPPSPLLAPAPDQEVDGAEQELPKPVEKPPEPPGFELPVEAIGQWIKGIQNDIQQVVERSQAKKKLTTDQVEKEAIDKRAEAAPPSAASPALMGVRQEQEGVRSEARMKRGGRPSYPWQAVQQQLEGRVVIEVVVEATGGIQAARVLRSSGHSLLDKAALEFAHEMSLEPASVDGKPVKSTVQIPISFRLK